MRRRRRRWWYFMATALSRMRRARVQAVVRFLVQRRLGLVLQVRGHPRLSLLWSSRQVRRRSWRRHPSLCHWRRRLHLHQRLHLRHPP